MWAFEFYDEDGSFCDACRTPIVKAYHLLHVDGTRRASVGCICINVLRLESDDPETAEFLRQADATCKQFEDRARAKYVRSILASDGLPANAYVQNADGFGFVRTGPRKVLEDYLVKPTRGGVIRANRVLRAAGLAPL